MHQNPLSKRASRFKKLKILNAESNHLVTTSLLFHGLIQQAIH